ncbi:MAG: hypothetical protein ACJ8CR_26880 [Roseiflexaceae bacterium]
MQQERITERLAQPVAAPQLWPEQPRDQPRPEDRFPLALFLAWIIPGLIGTIVLAATFIYLEQRASRQIVFLTPGGELGAVRADGTGVRTLNFANLEGARFAEPQWAPDGSRFAAVVSHQGKAELLLAQSQTITPTLLAPIELDNLFLPGQAWSYDSAYLALVGLDSTRGSLLQLADVQQGRVVTVALTLDRQASLDWHPQSDELLVTALTDNTTPTLRIVSTDSQSRPFTPQDNLVAHSAGAWSPDGKQIAYVAGASKSDLTGSIWVANRDGSNAHEIAKGDQSFAPIWAPRGDFLFFTRLVTETRDYELYRIKPDGQDQPAFIGKGLPPLDSPAINRRLLMDWSPDGGKLFFQSFDRQEQKVTLYGALYDGSNAQPLFSQPSSGSDPPLVSWAPTSRALLIASQSQGMFLRWIDQDRSATQLPRAFFPSWQPWK